MAKRTLTVTTPFGTFTRSTQTEYKFVGLAEFVGNDGYPLAVRWSLTRQGAEAVAKRQSVYETHPRRLVGVYEVA